MTALLLLFLNFITPAHADSEEICKYFKYCGSNGGQSSGSLPSAAASSTLNPGSIAKVKGLGLELVYQPNNPVGYSIVTGNGKFGGALVSSQGENTFFGNRSIEIDELYLQRRIDKVRYKNKKIHAAFGAAIVDKRDFGVDIGISLKRNPDIKKINPGFGISGKVYLLNFGVYAYKDDVKMDLGNYLNPYTLIPYTQQFSTSVYQETFNVVTYTLGTKVNNLALDMGIIRTNYNFYERDTLIKIYSASYMYKKFLFNLGYRQEESDNLKEDDERLVFSRKKHDFYGGIQFFLNRHFVLGAGYNNYLLNEVSGNLTLFW